MKTRTQKIVEDEFIQPLYKLYLLIHEDKPFVSPPIANYNPDYKKWELDKHMEFRKEHNIGPKDIGYTEAFWKDIEKQLAKYMKPSTDKVNKHHK